MRQYAWYSPDLNVIILQSIMDDCEITFEWGAADLYEARTLDMQDVLWLPLGEL